MHGVPVPTTRDSKLDAMLRTEVIRQDIHLAYKQSIMDFSMSNWQRSKWNQSEEDLSLRERPVHHYLVLNRQVYEICVDENLVWRSESRIVLEEERWWSVWPVKKGERIHYQKEKGKHQSLWRKGKIKRSRQMYLTHFSWDSLLVFASLGQELPWHAWIEQPLKSEPWLPTKRKKEKESKEQRASHSLISLGPNMRFISANLRVFFAFPIAGERTALHLKIAQLKSCAL